MTRLACVAALAALVPARIAAAEAAVAERMERPQLALAVNPPLRWQHGDAVGVSAYVGLAGHHAIRANVARYVASDGGATLIGDVFFDGDGSDAILYGHHLDVSVGYMYFPRHVLDGVFVEGALLVRDNQTRVEDDFSPYAAVVVTDSKTYAGRGLVGWSWLVGGHVFFQLAAGVSLGHEIGEEHRAAYEAEMLETYAVSRGHVGFEGFVRIGGAIGI